MDSQASGKVRSRAEIVSPRAAIATHAHDDETVAMDVFTRPISLAAGHVIVRQNKRQCWGAARLRGV